MSENMKSEFKQMIDELEIDLKIRSLRNSLNYMALTPPQDNNLAVQVVGRCQ